MTRFPYEKAELESVACNFCGGINYKILAKIGQDNLPLTTVMCRDCGLIFINPRMTAQWYFKYYQDEYRSKTIENNPARVFDFDALFEIGYQHGLALAKLISPHLKAQGPLVEVGSGVGGVLCGLKEKLGRQVVGVEPSKREAEYAERKGIKTLNLLFEDVDSQAGKLDAYSAVVCTQSLNHLLDPASFLRWARKRLTDNGILVLEVMNFRHQLKKAGLYKNAVKIDHPYMFMPETLANFITSVGFEILFFDTDEQPHFKNLGLPDTHIRLIARRQAKPTPSGISRRRPSLLDLLKLSPSVMYCHYLLFYRLRGLLK